MARVERTGRPIRAEGGGSGRRDPALRQRIAADQPYDDEATPEGVVGRRPQDEQPDDADFGEQLVPDPDELVDPSEGGAGDLYNPDDPLLLLPGDIIYGKVTHAIRFDEDPSYFTYGVATRVQDGELEEEAFDRVSTIVNERSLDLAYAAEEPVGELVERVEAKRRERINSRRALRARPTDGE